MKGGLSISIGMKLDWCSFLWREAEASVCGWYCIMYIFMKGGASISMWMIYNCLKFSWREENVHIHEKRSNHQYAESYLSSYIICMQSDWQLSVILDWSQLSWREEQASVCRWYRIDLHYRQKWNKHQYVDDIGLIYILMNIEASISMQLILVWCTL